MRAVTLGWGIVGFGWVAQDYFVPALQAAGHRLVGIVDPDPAAQRQANLRGAAAFPDAQSLAADRAVEAVYVATPNHLHRAAVEGAAASGKAVLCEKPMAATLDDALAMAEACRRAGILYGTAFDQRHHPAHRAMRDAVAAGVIGVPAAIRIVYACWVGRDWADAGGRENWRIDPRKAGGGALMDLAPHGLDLVEFLLGEPVAEIAALTQSRVQDYRLDDGGVIIGRTASGVLASLHVAYNCPEGLPRRRLEVVGSKGSLTAENTMGQEAGGTVGVTDGASGLSRPLQVPDAGASPFTNQVLAFAEALRSGDRSAFSPERDLHTMELIARAYDPDQCSRIPEGAAVNAPHPAPHAEVARAAGPRSTGDGRASFGADLRSAPEDEKIGSFG